MSILQQQDIDIFTTIQREKNRQENCVELIAAENYTSPAVLEAMGTVLNSKYSEGYIGRRYYAGNQHIDEIEHLAISRAKALFSAEHVNVQPLSGSPANSALYFAVLKPGDKIMGLKLDHGGHLSHGHPINFSGMLYQFVQYEVDLETGLINMEKVREIALKERPKMIVAGFSAYSRDIDWQAFKLIAEEIGAVAVADIAHIAGLIAGKALENPVPLFDIVSTTTHKTLRGPRGAILMCKKKYAQAIDKSVFPGMQGGPHDHITAAKAVCFKEALTPSFKEYARNIITNAKALCGAMQQRGYEILTGGTDNHLMVVDLRNKDITGKIAEAALDKIGVTCSRSTIPFDTRKAMNPSGIRLGTPAVTSRNMGVAEMQIIAELIDRALKNWNNDGELTALKKETTQLCNRFPLYR